MLSVFGSILLIALIILVIRLIIIANKVDKMIDEVNTKVAKFDNLFNIIDIVNNFS